MVMTFFKSTTIGRQQSERQKTCERERECTIFLLFLDTMCGKEYYVSRYLIVVVSGLSRSLIQGTKVQKRLLVHMGVHERLYPVSAERERVGGQCTDTKTLKTLPLLFWS
jgi:hypothetical protein